MEISETTQSELDRCLDRAHEFVAHFALGHNETEIAEIFGTKPEFVLWAVKKYLKLPEH